MPVIPYTGTPTIRPQGEPSAFLRPGGGAEAFGALEARGRGIAGQAGEAAARADSGEAAAIINIGEHLGQTGNVLAQHAVQMQQRLNEAEAQELYLKSEQAFGNETARYKSLEGKNAVDGLQDYQKNLQKIRENMLSGATNPDVKRLADQTLVRKMGLLMDYGASYAGQELKRYVKMQNAATVESALNDAAAAPDQGNFELAMARAFGAINSEAREGGYSPEQREQAFRKVESQAWANRLNRISVTDPKAAYDLYQSAKGRIDGTVQDQIEAMIHGRLVQVESRKLAGDVISGMKYSEDNEPAQVSQVVEKARSEAEARMPGDQVFADAAVSHSLQRYQQEIKAPIVEAQTRARLARAEQRQIQQEVLKDWGSKIVNDEPVTAQDITADRRITYNQQQMLMRQLQAKNKGEPPAVKSAGNTSQLYTKMVLPYGDPNKILDTTPIQEAFANRDINKADYNFLMKEFDAARSPENARLNDMKSALFANAKTSFDRLALAKNLDANTTMFKYQMGVNSKIEQYRAANKNPMDLFNPKNPDYVGSIEYLRSFQEDTQTLLRQKADSLRAKSVPSVTVPLPPSPDIPARLPNETPADYLKRTQGK